MESVHGRRCAYFGNSELRQSGHNVNWVITQQNNRGAGTQQSAVRTNCAAEARNRAQYVCSFQAIIEENKLLPAVGVFSVSVRSRYVSYVEKTDSYGFRTDLIPCKTLDTI